MVQHAPLRLYIDAPLAAGASVTLSKDQAHYLRNVMRRKVADTVLLFNGRDGEWQGQLATLEKKHADVLIETQTKPQRNEPDVWLVFAPIKHGRIDFLAQKATELGVAALHPIMTEYTNVTRVNTERLQANALEAAEQCERLSIPDVCEATSLDALLESWDSERKLLYCDESGQGLPVRDALARYAGKTQGKWAILIGPEGGFSEKERKRLLALDYAVPVGLGPRVMRADTAALAALTAWQMVLGDWDALPKFG